MANAQVAPNASFHYWGFGVKDKSLDKEKLATLSVCTRGLEFESGNEITTETDEGHTGASNLDMGSYRTIAESAPTWNDALRYGEGLEYMWYFLLGTVNPTGGTNTNTFTGKAYTQEDIPVTGVYQYDYSFPPTNANELPFITIYNGFAKTEGDARIWNNAVLNEFELSGSNEEVPRITPTFVSDYNNFNLENPVRSYGAKTAFAKPKDVSIYFADVGESDVETNGTSLSCVTEYSLTVNNNFEAQPCHDDEFGKNSKVMGVREFEGSITLPWTNASKLLEPYYEAGDKYGHIVDVEIPSKQIWFVFKTGEIMNEGAGTGVPYTTIVRIAKCELTLVESTLSGDEAKELTIEFKPVEEASQSVMTVTVLTDLDELTIDSTGVDLSTLYHDHSA